MYHIFGLKQGFSLFAAATKTRYKLPVHNGNIKPRLSICVVGFFTPQNIYHTETNDYNRLIGFGGADGGAVSAAYWRYSRAAGRFNVTLDPLDPPITLVIGQAYSLIFEVYDSHIKTTLGYYGKDEVAAVDYKMNGGNIIKTVLPLNARFAVPAARSMRLIYKLVEQE